MVYFQIVCFPGGVFPEQFGMAAVGLDWYMVDLWMHRTLVVVVGELDGPGMASHL